MHEQLKGGLAQAAYHRYRHAQLYTLFLQLQAVQYRMTFFISILCSHNVKLFTVSKHGSSDRRATSGKRQRKFP
jgi:hypothetical protein